MFQETMLTDNIYQRVRRIVELLKADVQELQQIGVTSEDKLLYAEFADYPRAIPVIKRRKLEIIKQYLAKGEVLDDGITMAQIQENLAAPPVPAGRLPPYPQGVAPDTNSGDPRVYTDPLNDLSGEAVDYEERERKSGLTIKKTAYKNILDGPSLVGYVIEEAISKEHYNMILSCVSGGHALNIIEKVRDEKNGVECGYKAWKSLKDWYLDPTQVDSMISHW